MQKKLSGLFLLAFSASIYAQQAPTAGNQLQQIPAPPALPKGAPQLPVAPAAAPDAAAPDTAAITVTTLRLTGHAAFSEAQLLAAARFEPGAAMTLAQLRAMAERIANWYHEHGYFLARAILPPQEVKDGVVTIAVLEGRYAKVSLRNASGVDDSVAQGLLAGLKPGDPVLIGPLETRLLLLSDLPGVTLRSTLVPGAAAGGTELVVDLAAAPRFSGSIDADNNGNRYTGKGRLGASVSVNQLAGLGDVLTLRAMSSAKGLDYGRAAYQVQAGRASVGAAYALMDYELGRDFAALQAHGTARIASLFASYPLLRSRAANLNARIGLDRKTLQDRQDVGDTVIDKKARVLTASLEGDRRGRLGSSRASVTLSSGSIDIRSPLALAADAATARVNGHYSKLAWSLAHVQQLSADWALQGALHGQLSSKNLDASEKMSLGGAGAVRAYPEGEAYADRATVLTLALKKSLGAQLQLVAFADAGTATLDKSPWGPGRRHRSLSGGGAGLEWHGAGGLLAKAYVARKFGAEAATSAPDKDYRVGFEAVKYF